MSSVIKSSSIAVSAIVFRSLYMCSAKFLTSKVGLSPFEILYQRFALTLPVVALVQLSRSSKDDTISIWKVSRQQIPYVFSRVMGSCICSCLQNYAMQYVSASKTLLVLENPFIPGIMAYLVGGEEITLREIFVYFMATVGLFCISSRHGALQIRSKSSADAYIMNETIGIVLICVASGIQALGIIALRQLKKQNMEIDSVVLMIFIGLASLVINSGMLILFDKSPVYYTEEIWLQLFLMSCASTVGMVLSNYLYQYFKVSWSIIILNLQIVFIFAFDVLVMEEQFTVTQVLGCVLMFLSNVLLVI